jgi:hypothetical protein
VVNRKTLDAAAPLEYFQFEILDIPKTKSCAFYDVNFVGESFRSSIRKFMFEIIENPVDVTLYH